MNGFVDIARNALVLGTLLGVAAFVLVKAMFIEDVPPAMVRVRAGKVPRPNVVEARAGSSASGIGIERIKVMQPVMTACQVEPSAQEAVNHGRIGRSPPLVADSWSRKNESPQGGFSVDTNPACVKQPVEVVLGRMHPLHDGELKKQD